MTTTDALVRSLNRVRVAEIPGIPAADELIGRTAFDLLSAEAIGRLIRDAAGTLGLDLTGDDPLRAFDRSFDGSRARPTAQAIAEQVGRRLGALLLVLWRGDPANRAARPEWDNAHWAYWRAVQQVVIGGGLLAGRLGELAVPAAAEWLAGAGCPIAVRRSPWGETMPLAGLARHAPPGATRMLLFDFGQTSVKRGLALYPEGQPPELRRWPSLPAPERGTLDEPSATTAQRWMAMRDIVAADWQTLVETGTAGDTALGLSIAAHLRDGHTLDSDRSGYSRLGRLAPHLATFIRDDLAASLGRFSSLALLHDGLAAATVCAGRPATVVLTLGTAIGVGYPPPDDGLRPLPQPQRPL